MNTKLYLTVAAVVAILYALAFLLIPVQASLFFSNFAEPRAILISAVLWCGDLGVGANCLVCTKLRGSVRGAQRFNSQPCGSSNQHRDKCVGDVAGLAQRESAGFDVGAWVVVGLGSL
jgi:hypothetical protein